MFNNCSREIERWIFNSSFNQIVYTFFTIHSIQQFFYSLQLNQTNPCINSIHPALAYCPRHRGHQHHHYPTLWIRDKSGNRKSNFMRFILAKLIPFLTFFLIIYRLLLLYLRELSCILVVLFVCSSSFTHSLMVRSFWAYSMACNLNFCFS